jgi:hypothetical protein
MLDDGEMPLHPREQRRELFNHESRNQEWTPPSSPVSTAETLRPAGPSDATHLPRNRVAPTLTMQELLAAKAGRLMSV